MTYIEKYEIEGDKILMESYGISGGCYEKDSRSHQRR